MLKKFFLIAILIFISPFVYGQVNYGIKSGIILLTIIPLKLIYLIIMKINLAFISVQY